LPPTRGLLAVLIFTALLFVPVGGALILFIAARFETVPDWRCRLFYERDYSRALLLFLPFSGSAWLALTMKNRTSAALTILLVLILPSVLNL